MYNEVRAVTLNATFSIEGNAIVSMYAQKSENGSNVNISIQSKELYEANKAECDEAIEMFKKHANEL